MLFVVFFHHGKRVISSAAPSCRLVQLAAGHMSGSAGDGGGHRPGPGGGDRRAAGYLASPQEPLGCGRPGPGSNCALHLRVVPPCLVPLYGACGAFLPTGPLPGLAVAEDLEGAALPVCPGGRASFWEAYGWRCSGPPGPAGRQFGASAAAARSAAALFHPRRSSPRGPHLPHLHSASGCGGQRPGGCGCGQQQFHQRPASASSTLCHHRLPHGQGGPHGEEDGRRDPLICCQPRPVAASSGRGSHG